MIRGLVSDRRSGRTRPAWEPRGHGRGGVERGGGARRDRSLAGGPDRSFMCPTWLAAKRSPCQRLDRPRRGGPSTSDCESAAGTAGGLSGR